jgi:succinate dehydrogenase / fumarate reductase, iron-sulfur subunit
VSDNQWQVTFIIQRQRSDGKKSFQNFTVEVDPDEYVLDGIERIWAFQDRTLTFRHACHHSTCGACGMVVNGVEKLTCITAIRDVTHNGGTVRVEPLHNFPVLSDLVVDMSTFYNRLEDAGLDQVAPNSGACLPFEKKAIRQRDLPLERLVDCIECGCCISACPSALTSPSYVGPGVLAAIQQGYTLCGDPTLLEQADCADGAWRCHSAFECTAVCPSHVDPAWRIMNLRRQIIIKGKRSSQSSGKEK